MSDVDLSVPLNSILGVDEYEVGRFGESIHDHQIELNLRAINDMPTMKSMRISSHFHSGTLSGCNSLPGFI
jgi:hypothetical protein